MSKHRFNLSRWALEHPALTRYLMVALLVLGVAAYFQLGQDEDPPFTFRAMVVRTYWPGATAQQVAEQVTDKVERTLQEVPYADKIRSYSKPGESLIIVSAGTATTVDCVRAEPPAAAVFLGGGIAPGFELMRLALARGTARLPLVEEDAATVAPLPYPATTEAAIAAGVFFAQLGLVERVVREFSAELRHAQRQPPRLLLTGGRGRALLGPLTRSLLPVAAVSALSLESDLILRGVALRALSERAPSPAEPTATGPAASSATLTSR